MRSTNSNDKWVPVVGHEGIYEVSDSGSVRSLDRYIYALNNGTYCKRFIPGKMLKTDIDEDGYVRINLQDKNHKGHRYGVHRLVAAAFIPNPCNKPTVNHKDGNKQNNSVDNLEWATDQEQSDHAIALGLRNADTYKNRDAVKKKLSKRCKCVETGQEFDSMIEAERKLNLGSTAVYHSIVNHRPTVNGLTFVRI